MTLDEESRIIRETLDTVGASDCPTPDVGWTRAVKAVGRAKILDLRHRGIAGGWSSRIEFSTHAWPLMSPEERRQTIVHEACHVAASWLHSNRMLRLTGYHGALWAALMLRAGAQPDPFCTVPHVVHAMQAIRTRNYVRVTCDCGPVSMFSPQRAAKMRKGSTYLCRRCFMPFRFSEAA